MQKKGFTLVEMLIVIVIVGLLTTVLFRSYATISEISAKIENTKTVSTQLGLMQTYIQSFTNGAKINYNIYTGDNPKKISDNGWTDEIILTGRQFVNIYSTGECFDYTGYNSGFTRNISQKKCRIEANINGEISHITDPNKIYISNIVFQLFPQKYYTGNALNYFNNSQYRKSEGFRMFGQIWIKNRNENRVSNVHNNFQYFFGL